MIAQFTASFGLVGWLNHRVNFSMVKKINVVSLALLGVKHTVAPGQLGHFPVLYLENPKHLLL